MLAGNARRTRSILAGSVSRAADLAYCATMSEGDPGEGPKGPKIQLQMDEQTALGRYSNLVLINHTENEFLLDFAFLQPGNPKAKVVARIISSPRHTKRLLRALQKNIDRFEERFGEVDVGDAGEDPVVH
jgi:hypothetical protein